MISVNIRVRKHIVIARVLSLLCLLVFVCGQEAFAQQSTNKKIITTETRRDEMHIRFVVAKSNINPSYMNNADSLNRIIEWVDKMQRDSMIQLVSVEFCGAVSPEGSVRFNHYLSNARLKALEKYVRSRIDIPEELIVRNDHYIAWDELEDMVIKSDLENKEEILKILRSENRSTGEELDSRIGDLKKMDNGVTWMKLYKMFFIHMRNAYTVLVTRERFEADIFEPILKATIEPEFDMHSTLPPISISKPLATHIAAPEMRYMYVKSNLAGLGLLMANLGVEFDMGRYFSFSLPVYYSAVNYFVHTLKFRTFAVQPELRFWPTKNNDGLFIGAHMGFAYYNFAFNGDWRYQDRNGTTPTLGGGLSVGYRTSISRNDRWKLEIAAGAGIYPLHYDVFHNEYNGQLYDTRKKTYFGLDNLQIGISYRIPMKEVQPKK